MCGWHEGCSVNHLSELKIRTSRYLVYVNLRIVKGERLYIMKQRNFLLQQLIVGICAGMAGNAWCAEAGQDAAHTMNEVVVTSTTIDDRFAGRRGEASSVTDISGKEVDKKRPDNMIRILQSIPGITADLSSGDEIKIKFRGVENQVYMGEKPGVAIIIDGVPVFERTGKVNVDLDNIESIKVIKGGASYLFGEDALAGAVVITTKRGAKYAGATVSYDVGAWGYQRALGRVGFAGDWGAGHIQVTQRKADDYYYQSGYQTDYVNGSLRFYLSDRSDLTVNVEKSDRTKDKHGNVTGATQASIDPTGMLGRDYTRKYNVDLDKVNATYALELADGGNLLATVYQYKDHTLFWSAPRNYTTAGAPDSANDSYTVNNDYHQTQRGAKGEWRNQSGVWAWMGGVDLRHNEYLNLNTARMDYCTSPGGACTKTFTGSVLQNDHTDELTKALYGEMKWAAIPDWVFTGNLRADAIGLEYKGEPNKDNPSTVVASKDFSAQSWRLGSSWQAQTDTNIFANISTGFRTPTAQQLYNGSISPTGKTANNENLKPETSMNYEAGVRADRKFLGFDYNTQASLFMIERKDYIMATTGDYGLSSATYQQKYDNIGGVRNSGLELALKTDSKREWSLDVAYTYVDARFTKYDNFNMTLGNPYATGAGACNLTNTPSNSACRVVPYGLAGKRVPRVAQNQMFSTLHWAPISVLHFGLEMDAKQWAYADEINQEKLPGRTLFNLVANYDIKEKGFMSAKWSLFARVDNLLDRNYWQAMRGTSDAKGYVTGQTTYNGIYNANDPSIIVGKPRSWMAGVTATF